MIDNSVIKRLAIQCGIDPMFNQDEQLQAFAKAVIEDYKVKLRPVTIQSSYAGVEIQLYALPSGETK